MPIIDLYTTPGQAGVDPDRQRALLVAWLLLASNAFLTMPQTRIVKTDVDMRRLEGDGERPGSQINYVDMRDIYPRLAPLTTQEVDDLFTLVRGDRQYQTVGSDYWSEGEAMLHYTDHYCLAMNDILAMND